MELIVEMVFLLAAFQLIKPHFLTPQRDNSPVALYSKRS